MNIKQLDRAVNVINATLTLDVETVQETDGSAASRIVPIINTLNMDLDSKETWFGKGTIKKEDVYRGMSQKARIGNIDQYGLISYIVSLFLVFSCCMNFRSLPTIMFFVGVGGGVTNIAYLWSILMVFTVIRYFQTKYKRV